MPKCLASSTVCVCVWLCPAAHHQQHQAPGRQVQYLLRQAAASAAVNVTLSHCPSIQKPAVRLHGWIAALQSRAYRSTRYIALDRARVVAAKGRFAIAARRVGLAPADRARRHMHAWCMLVVLASAVSLFSFLASFTESLANLCNLELVQLNLFLLPKWHDTAPANFSKTNKNKSWHRAWCLH
jgi:hypothetical protein